MKCDVALFDKGWVPLVATTLFVFLFYQCYSPGKLCHQHNRSNMCVCVRVC